jgi:hypothetical protein
MRELNGVINSRIKKDQTSMIEIRFSNIVTIILISLIGYFLMIAATKAMKAKGIGGISNVFAGASVSGGGDGSNG